MSFSVISRFLLTEADSTNNNNNSNGDIFDTAAANTTATPRPPSSSQKTKAIVSYAGYRSQDKRVYPAPEDQLQFSSMVPSATTANANAANATANMMLSTQASLALAGANNNNTTTVSGVALAPMNTIVMSPSSGLPENNNNNNITNHSSTFSRRQMELQEQMTVFDWRRKFEKQHMKALKEQAKLQGGTFEGSYYEDEDDDNEDDENNDGNTIEPHHDFLFQKDDNKPQDLAQQIKNANRLHKDSRVIDARDPIVLAEREEDDDDDEYYYQNNNNTQKFAGSMNSSDSPRVNLAASLNGSFNTQSLARSMNASSPMSNNKKKSFTSSSMLRNRNGTSPEKRRDGVFDELYLAQREAQDPELRSDTILNQRKKRLSFEMKQNSIEMALGGPPSKFTRPCASVAGRRKYQEEMTRLEHEKKQELTKKMQDRELRRANGEEVSSSSEDSDDNNSTSRNKSTKISSKNKEILSDFTIQQRKRIINKEDKTKVICEQPKWRDEGRVTNVEPVHRYDRGAYKISASVTAESGDTGALPVGVAVFSPTHAQEHYKEVSDERITSHMQNAVRIPATVMEDNTMNGEKTSCRDELSGAIMPDSSKMREIKRARFHMMNHTSEHPHNQRNTNSAENNNNHHHSKSISFSARTTVNSGNSSRSHQQQQNINGGLEPHQRYGMSSRGLMNYVGSDYLMMHKQHEDSMRNTNNNNQSTTNMASSLNLTGRRRGTSVNGTGGKSFNPSSSARR